MADQQLAYARELAERDASLAAAITVVEALRARTRSLRGEAAGLLAMLDRLPAERTGAAAALERTEHELALRRDELAAAERELEKRPSDRRTLAAERARLAHARAQDDRSAAARRATALAHEEDEARAEAERLERAATELAAGLDVAPRVAARSPGAPGPGLDALLVWAGRADGALMLAGSGLSAERDGVVREANELASAVLGEQPVPAGVDAIVERLYRSLGSPAT